MGDQQMTRKDVQVAVLLCTLGAVLGFFSTIFAVSLMICITTLVRVMMIVPANTGWASWFGQVFGPNWNSSRRTWWLSRAPFLAIIAGILMRWLYRFTVPGAI
jgi:hypothetical protein